MTELPNYTYVPDEPGENSGGCFLFTLPGCLISGCIALAGCVCLLIVGPCVGIATLAALFLSNPATEADTRTFVLESVESARLEIQDDKAEVTITGVFTEGIIIDHKLTAYGYSQSNAESALEDIDLNIERLSDGTIQITVDDSASTFSIYDLELDIKVPYGLKISSSTPTRMFLSMMLRPISSLMRVPVRLR